MHFRPVQHLLLAGLLTAPGALAGELHTLAVAAGKKYFGTAVDNPELDDAAYKAILGDAGDFGQVTVGNTQKWDTIEPSPGTFNFAKGDVVADFAKTNNQILRCHTLVWYNQLPSWVSSGTWTTETLTGVINTHIENEVGHYKGQCYAWDVVNEALEDDATFRQSVFMKVLGTDYIPIAFKAAAAADPDAKLYYNDYNIEHSGAKQKAALEIVDLIQASGAKIDGVGLQGHFIVGSTPSQKDLAAVLSEFAAKNVEVAYTEIDVRFSSLPSTEAGLTQQATDYGNIVGACLDVAECVGVTIWGASDKYSWIPSTFSGQGDACLFDTNMATKPAYDKVKEVLAAAGTGGSAPVPSTSASPAVSTTSASTTSRAAATLVSSSSTRSVPTTLSTVNTSASSSPSEQASQKPTTSPTPSSSWPTATPTSTRMRCPGRRRRRAAPTHFN